MYEKTTKWLTFQEIYSKRKTKIINVYNNEDNEWLGEIKWRATWRQYCFYTDGSILAESCLDDISSVIKELKQLRKDHKLTQKQTEDK